MSASVGLFCVCLCASVCLSVRAWCQSAAHLRFIWDPAVFKARLFKLFSMTLFLCATANLKLDSDPCLSSLPGVSLSHMKDGVGDILLHLRPQCWAYSIWFKQGRCQSGCKSTRLLTVLFSHLWKSIQSDIRQAYYGSWQPLVSNLTMPHICLLSCTWAKIKTAYVSG